MTNRTIKRHHDNNGLIIEMKEQSIIRNKKRIKGSCSSLKNGNCPKSLAGLHSSSGDANPELRKGASNSQLNRTQTRFGGLSFEGFSLGSPLQKKSGPGERGR